MLNIFASLKRNSLLPKTEQCERGFERQCKQMACLIFSIFDPFRHTNEILPNCIGNLSRWSQNFGRILNTYTSNGHPMVNLINGPRIVNYNSRVILNPIYSFYDPRKVNYDRRAFIRLPKLKFYRTLRCRYLRPV